MDPPSTGQYSYTHTLTHTHSPTSSLTHSATHPSAHLLTRPLAHSPICPSAHLFICLGINTNKQYKLLCTYYCNKATVFVLLNVVLNALTALSRSLNYCTCSLALETHFSNNYISLSFLLLKIYEYIFYL